VKQAIEAAIRHPVHVYSQAWSTFGTHLDACTAPSLENIWFTMLLELGLYPELSILPDTTKHRDRATQWKKNTTDFCERYIATHDFLDINKASDRPKTAEAPRVRRQEPLHEA
jgi:hypothetical protein